MSGVRRAANDAKRAGASGNRRFDPDTSALLRIFHDLSSTYGDLGWWPGDTRFEIMVGAVLTQNTAWTNVEKAIANLRTGDALTLDAMLDMPATQLAALIRPSGYFNVKADRLGHLCRFIVDNGGEAGLDAMPTDDLRPALLGVKGIGPETCDDILLYAYHRPVFVIDAYTRRLLQRHGLAQGDEPYEVLRAGFERALGPNVPLFQAYHGLIVEHAKRACAVKPRCAGCCLSSTCAQRG